MRKNIIDYLRIGRIVITVKPCKWSKYEKKYHDKSECEGALLYGRQVEYFYNIFFMFWFVQVLKLK